jgi:hypothetical protein
MWLSEPGYRGPVLVRGRMVEGRARVGFGRARVPSLELALPAGDWDESGGGSVRVWGKTFVPPRGWRVTSAATRVRGRGQGEQCYFFQVDGMSFSETVVFGVIVE